MRLILEVVSGPAKGKRIEAALGQTISIGRTKKADVALGDNFMSGVHFAIECKAKSCHVRDLKSRNGTKLNGELITDAVLKDGDRLFAGKTDFVARVEAARSQSTADAAAELRSPPRRRVSRKLPAAAIPQAQPAKNQGAAPAGKVPEPGAFENSPSASAKPELKPTHTATAEKPPTPAREAAIPMPALESYEAVTPQGRLLHILSNQPQTVMALIDAIRNAKVLELLRGTREEYQALYRGEQNLEITPYLVRLPPRSDLLKRMIQLGWGIEWGVYLTCPLSVAELRQYFRTALMVGLPDGAELFSRFYDPRFFRPFLETCTGAEAEKFFGPVTAYFMEDQRPEILLEFARDNNGVKKRGHLLSDLL